MPDENGETRRERFDRFKPKHAEPPPEIEPPPDGDHVWEWFWELSPRRKSGPEPLSYAEIGEWQRLTGVEVRREEVEMLMRMDDAFIEAVRQEQRDAAIRAQEKAKG